MDKLSLSDLGGGAVEARFQEALAMVGENIDDPNTSASAKRSIMVKVVFTPSASRRSSDIDVTVDTKLAGALPIGSTGFFGKQDGKVVVHEFNPDQMELDDVPREVRVAPVLVPKEGGER